jgi:hypothetical protein
MTALLAGEIYFLLLFFLEEIALSPFNYCIHLNSPFIYKTEQCPSLCIENMQIAPIV